MTETTPPADDTAPPKPGNGTAAGTGADAATDTAPEEKFVLSTSRTFSGWLNRTGGSLAFTTYQAGKVFFVGSRPDGRHSVHERTFARSMGMCASPDARTLYMASHYQLYRFDNLLPPGASASDGSDAVYVPRQSWITGDLDIHDIVVGPDGNPVFINTVFSCVATVSPGFSFKPLWKPPFVTKLAPEDRCHLNGLASRDGKPRYVTGVGPSDVADGWRDRRKDGGFVMDIETNRMVCEGLSMPHSPRMRDGKLWLLDSGTGHFGFVDLDTGRFERVAFCPGYARGLTFAGNTAIIGLSLARHSRTFQGLALDDELKAKGTEARCGLLVVDLATGDTVAWVRIEGVVNELYDVVFLPGVIRPAAIGFKTDEITRLIAIDDTEPLA